MIRRIQTGEAGLFKQMRLASLRDAPYAFSSTYESALCRSAESWREQADSTAQGTDRATFIAFSDDAPIGIAALYRLPDQLEAGEVLQVWVAPEYRGTRVARDLMDVVFEWAGDNGFCTIIARITKGNTRALKFYRKYGFALAKEASLNSSDGVSLVREVGSEQSHLKRERA
jgi:GNAT superfamily N-acetyltransferase